LQSRDHAISPRFMTERAPMCAVYCEQCPTIDPTSRRLRGWVGLLV
jgi:hypothetical protein